MDSEIKQMCQHKITTVMLGHVIGGVRGIYDRHEYGREKLLAFEALAAQIERIVNPPASNVTALRG
jgi:hypothetical protein